MCLSIIRYYRTRAVAFAIESHLCVCVNNLLLYNIIFYFTTYFLLQDSHYPFKDSQIHIFHFKIPILPDHISRFTYLTSVIDHITSGITFQIVDRSKISTDKADANFRLVSERLRIMLKIERGLSKPQNCRRVSFMPTGVGNGKLGSRLSAAEEGRRDDEGAPDNWK